jgi:hypothetical protein
MSVKEYIVRVPVESLRVKKLSNITNSYLINNHTKRAPEGYYTVIVSSPEIYSGRELGGTFTSTPYAEIVFSFTYLPLNKLSESGVRRVYKK